ncbi:MAG: FAD-dependent monooxygenase [Myxococcaceae bacterium]|nr:FAD-dependent monooxygenase [Myxococcaceae bacterium]
MSAPRRVLIAGAGIGGLTLAAALRRHGFDVQVFEKARKLEALGAGIVLAANALWAIQRLGFYEEVCSAGLRLSGGDVRTWKGCVLSGSDFEDLERELGVFVLAYHRADLHEALLRCAGADCVRLGTSVESFDQDDDGVRVLLGDGTQVDGDLLVGADGLHSRVRSAWRGREAPCYSGYTSWRGVAPAEAALHPSRSSESWGPGKRFGIVPLSRGRVYWFAVENAPAGGSDGPAGPKPHLREAFGGWHEPIAQLHEPIAQLIDATPEEAIVRTDIVDRDPIDRWGEGRVTLLGDAAHPMTPNMGQGACQAVEDAFVLTQELTRPSVSVAQALRAYEARRIPRTSAIVLQSRRFGEVAQWSNGVARWLRDRAMSALPKRAVVNQLRRTLLDPSFYSAG